MVYDYDPDWVYTQPLRASDIRLENREKDAEAPFISDSERWLLGAALLSHNRFRVYRGVARFCPGRCRCGRSHRPSGSLWGGRSRRGSRRGRSGYKSIVSKPVTARGVTPAARNWSAPLQPRSYACLRKESVGTSALHAARAAMTSAASGSHFSFKNSPCIPLF
jgi:hypothetical protein